MTFIMLTMDDKKNPYANRPTPTMINTTFIRCFYPRRQGLTGTRLTFMNGTGFAVTEDMNVVTKRIRASMGRRRRSQPRKKSRRKS